MYARTGYAREADSEIEILDKPLFISGCGIYRLIRLPSFATIRLEGRRDYQLLYVASGKAHFWFQEQEVEAAAGSMVLYRPGESQRYCYYAKENPEVCWIHFSGYEACEILDSIGFSGTNLLFCGASSHFSELFGRIISELQRKRPCFEELLCLMLRELFCHIRRGQLEASVETFRNHEEIEDCVRFFNDSFSDDIRIEEYAKNRNMSVCWFIRLFKERMGVTPMQYLIYIRINRAKELLKNTNYSVQEISSLVGYEDPFYFSRLFRKQTGRSPSAYRREWHDRNLKVSVANCIEML